MTRRKIDPNVPAPMIDAFDPSLFITPRHRARHRLPAGYWLAWTTVLWTVAACFTMLSVLAGGLVFGPLGYVAFVLFVAGIWTFVRTWRRMS
jgi:hypothetical protein